MNTSDTLSDSAEKWRCVRGKPKSEHLAAQHLKAAGFEAFCPRIRHQKQTTRGRVWYVEALFPGYLFVRYAPLNVRQVAATPFVSQVLSFMEDFGAVPELVITELRTAVDAQETVTVASPIRPGDAVDVVAGPLRGQAVTVTQVLPGAQRVRVLLEFLGSPHEVEVSILTLLSGRDPRVQALPRSAA
ncbi:MAG TPA: transcription termination/antitermination NusG family protein [Verrucomicrobiales bacterium]|jgi:transcriptional antiterminator RfaH|nr:transcription termination/antitermination NusG family protein [Verrucomicrobiales bacterium]